MSGVGILLLLTALLLLLGGLEYAVHRSNLRRIPIRIHVNGTRGKSSVARLIAAGLRAGGRRTVAKTTGTLARMILPDGDEHPVFRPNAPNVIEQVRLVATAVTWQAEVLVVECMALQPFLQWLSEGRLVRATHGVITNARPDHLDVMGPDARDVAWALAGMVPPGERLYTAEHEHRDVFDTVCRDRGTELVTIDEAQVDAVDPADLAGFGYVEHAENVALALRICADLGVDREVALCGMWAAEPDAGVLTEQELDWLGRRVVFVNAFAANDPESTERIWSMALERHPEVARRVAVINCRADRHDRSLLLGRAVPSWTLADAYVLVGSGTDLFARSAIRAGLEPHRLVFAEDQEVHEAFETILGLCATDALVMGMANIGGPGLDLGALFRERSRLTEGST